jgi:hypothetical protein
MGLFSKFMARRGNFPGTAEWVCKTYEFAKKKWPELSGKELLRMATRLRYAAGKDPGGAYDRIQMSIRYVEDLADYAVLVLDAETNFIRDSPEGFLDEVKNVMREVIGRHGLAEVRFDSSSEIWVSKAIDFLGKGMNKESYACWLLDTLDPDTDDSSTTYIAGLEAKMTAGEVSEARELAREWSGANWNSDGRFR